MTGVAGTIQLRIGVSMFGDKLAAKVIVIYKPMTGTVGTAEHPARIINAVLGLARSNFLGAPTIAIVGEAKLA